MLPLPHSSYLIPISHCLGDNYDVFGLSGFVLRVQERYDLQNLVNVTGAISMLTCPIQR